jgi:hypothetical protein
MRGLTALVFCLIVSTVLFAQEDPIAETDTAAVEAYESEEYTSDSVWSDSEYEEDENQESSAPVIDPKYSESVAEYMKEDQRARKFDKDEWKSIVGDETFQEKAQPKPKPWKPWFNMPSIPIGVIQIISYALIFVAVGFILYYVLRNVNMTHRIKKKGKVTDIAAPVEDIEEIDIDGLLRQALAEGNFRLAVRVHYLLLLKKLNEVEFIVWKKDKTNRDYLSELYGRDAVYEDVRRLTLAYELVWYGERSVSQDSFQRISGEFESVNRQVVKDKPEA